MAHDIPKPKALRPKPETLNPKAERKQVLGDIYMAHDIGPDDCIVVGKDGLLLSGPNALILEPLVLYYVSLLAREVFIRNYFMRIFVLVDTLAKIRQLILRYESDPDNIVRIRHVYHCCYCYCYC